MLKVKYVSIPNTIEVSPDFKYLVSTVCVDKSVKLWGSIKLYGTNEMEKSVMITTDMLVYYVLVEKVVDNAIVDSTILLTGTTYESSKKASKLLTDVYVDLDDMATLFEIEGIPSADQFDRQSKLVMRKELLHQLTNRDDKAKVLKATINIMSNVPNQLVIAKQEVASAIQQ